MLVQTSWDLTALPKYAKEKSMLFQFAILNKEQKKS